MRQFGAFYAKTHFSELLADVAKGDKILITRHGLTVAMLIPFTQSEEKEEVPSAIRAIKNLRAGTTLGKGLSIKEMKNMGRA